MLRKINENIKFSNLAIASTSNDDNCFVKIYYYKNEISNEVWIQYSKINGHKPTILNEIMYQIVDVKITNSNNLKGNIVFGPSTSCWFNGMPPTINYFYS